MMTMPIRMNRAACAAIALSLGLAVSGCNTPGTMNRSLNSVKQPVIEQSTFALDLSTTSDGLPVPEQHRLSDWFQAMNVGYGDRIAVDDASGNPDAREDVARIAGRHGLLLSDGAPVTNGVVEPGTVRVVITRTHASVPNCPDWATHVADYGTNTTSSGFGCAVNGNLAAMVANPEDLIHGASGNGDTVIMTSTKAIDTYREQKPTGAAGLPAVSSESGK
jgi:pilus assembly protein CpaD